MAFPPEFLEELRHRLSLANVVSRRVKLQRRGREFVGLCPFHKEKTPSFAVVEDKRFFHCFGCGAHGDVISFSMQSANLSFPEAVESLAREAGLEVPQASREDRERAARQTTLRGAIEAAAEHFEAQLHGTAGRDALAYLVRRGLDHDTIRRFRLGFAPDRRDGIRQALGSHFPEALLREAGLVRQREEGGDSYDYFRGRVMFPISDRGGRIIAFGGRILGEGEPKYLNSPETPLFEKGRVLYGWAQARAAAGGKAPVVVVEGYMDVIAMHRAGFVGTVAPLGTALTERQIEELWRLGAEPILCFDGDTAGLRAAARAVGRALPLLKPGRSLRFATLPQGEDPDTLVLRHGVAAMREVLDRAQPLVEFLWAIESTAHPLDTPERRAALERRLQERVREIADRSVQDHYGTFLRDRAYQYFRKSESARNPALRSTRRTTWGRKNLPAPYEAAPQAPSTLGRRQEEVLLASLLNHPGLLDAVAEELAELEFVSRDLDRLSRELLHLHAARSDLDAAALQLHLSQGGFAAIVNSLLTPQVLNHASFARREADLEAARAGWHDAKVQFAMRRDRRSGSPVDGEGGGEMTEEWWERLRALHEQREDEQRGNGGAVG